jgi:glycerol-3-phosphate dehydrogenase
MQRQQIIEHYRQHGDVSVLIVGAGINGIGAFRDLALQGVDVLMVDKDDFCSGASAASSRMAHGGIRYLETGEFRLVRESLAERNRLYQNAPHAVEPLLFSIPVYSQFSGILNAPLKFLGLLKQPSERGAVVVKLGMMMYDLFTRNDRVLPTHEFLGREEALQKHPKLTSRVVGLGTYYDTMMPMAERIGVEMVLDAEEQNPQAHALNYVRLSGREGDAVQLCDEVSGETFSVKPQLVINAAGAWIDFANRTLERETRFIGGTKGSHIVVDHPELRQTLKDSAIFFENKDGRMCIFAPIRDKVMIGATDIPIEDPDEAICTDEEIDYFLTFTEHVMPDVQVDRSQIVYHFSGVRPLPRSDVEFTGLISRDHSIRTVERNSQTPYPIYSLIGGKWTTFRAFAEQVTDKALAYLGQERQTSTADEPIGGGREYPHQDADREHWLAQLQQQTGLPRERIDTLFERYGTRAADVATYIAADEDTPLTPNLDYTRREVMFIAEREKVVRLSDFIIRRSMLGLLGCVDGDTLQAIGEAVGAAQGWSEDRVQQEVRRTADHLVQAHGVPAAWFNKVL